jgi:hypothetical protein
MPMQHGEDWGEPAPPPEPTSRETWIFIVAVSLVTAVITFGLTDRHMSWPWVLVVCVAIAAAAVLISRHLRRP